MGKRGIDPMEGCFLLWARGYFEFDNEQHVSLLDNKMMEHSINKSLTKT